MNKNMELISEIKSCIDEGKYRDGERMAAQAMKNNPNSPVPHNLMGIILEKENKHVQAMKHFRAAYALDPTYIPARFNMEQYGTFFPMSNPAYSEEECVVRFQHDSCCDNVH